MLKPRINDRVELPIDEADSSVPYGSLKKVDCVKPDLQLLTVAEAADLLRISVVSVRRLQRQRCIPFIKIGGRVRFTRGDIEAFLAKQRVEAVD